MRGTTILFENLGSSGFADRLIAENARTISENEVTGALRARSTKLYAIAASSLGSADRKRWSSMDTVKRVTLNLAEY